MDDQQQFERQKSQAIQAMAEDAEMDRLSHEWFKKSCDHNYSYNFTWLGLPIIQYPQDILAMQEIIWQVRPQRVVETGIARGGSLVFYASLLKLLGEEGLVVGIDLDIRKHNRQRLENHPLMPGIRLIEGSSIDEGIFAQVQDQCDGAAPVVVVLDSNHTHDHVLAELRLYSTLVGKGSHLVVFDTVVEDLPADYFPERPWGHGNNPKTAVQAFLAENDRFEIDREIQNKLQLTVAPDGFLKCIKD
ncbi:MAG: cephalosporin hydroxylase family protein [Magnetococcales bacterium]|nr:cephalosporin hydroxylase family protein [Magnetococcales bacterium]